MRTMSDEIPTLHPSTEFNYLAEGATNVVYRMHLPAAAPAERGEGDEQLRDGTPPPTELDDWEVLEEWLVPPPGMLLRLRKDAENASAVVESQRVYEDAIKPLFESDMLIHQSLVRIPEGVIEVLNAELKDMESDGR